MSFGYRELLWVQPLQLVPRQNAGRLSFIFTCFMLVSDLVV